MALAVNEEPQRAVLTPDLAEMSNCASLCLRVEGCVSVWLLSTWRKPRLVLISTVLVNFQPIIYHIAAAGVRLSVRWSH